MAKRRLLKRLKGLTFERRPDKDKPIIDQFGRLNPHGYNRVFSTVAHTLAWCEGFGIPLHESCYYFSSLGAHLINSLNLDCKKAKAVGGQSVYLIQYDGQWLTRWTCVSEHHLDKSEAKHVIIQLGSGSSAQMIDFQALAVLSNKIKKGEDVPLIPIMFLRICSRSLAFGVPRKGSARLCSYFDHKPTHHRAFWDSEDQWPDIEYLFDEVLEIWKQGIVCKELCYYGNDIDYHDMNSYIWPNSQ